MTGVEAPLSLELVFARQRMGVGPGGWPSAPDYVDPADATAAGHMAAAAAAARATVAAGPVRWRPTVTRSSFSPPPPQHAVYY